MIVRGIVAVVGAAVVTCSLLLAMNALTRVFTRQSGLRYFVITDILPTPEPGRPERPPSPERAPATDFRIDTNVETATPIGIARPTEIELEAPAPQVGGFDIEADDASTGEETAR